MSGPNDKSELIALVLCVLMVSATALALLWGWFADSKGF